MPDFAKQSECYCNTPNKTNDGDIMYERIGGSIGSDRIGSTLMTRTLLLNRWRWSGHIEDRRRGSPRAIAVYIKCTRGDESARRRKRDKKLEHEGKNTSRYKRRAGECGQTHGRTTRRPHLRAISFQEMHRVRVSVSHCAIKSNANCS